MEEQSEVERILQLAGIASAPMDPSSLEALRQLTRDRKNPEHAESAAAAAAAVNVNVNVGGGLATPSFVNTASIPLSSSQQHQQQQHHQQQHEQQQLWEMIQYQTNLLLETQRQLQALNEKVDSLGQDFKTYNKRSDPSFVPQASGATPALSTGATPSEGTANTLPPLQREQLQQQQQLRRGPQNNNDLPLRQRLLQLSIVRIVRLFWIQSKQVVRPIDGALLFKLFFMILILSARMSRSNSNNNPHRRHHQHSSSSKTSLPLSFLQQYRYALAMMLLLLGFLYHTRYLQFIYQFVWKQNIVMRIAWYGERVEGEESWEEELNVSQQQQQQQQQQRGLPDDIRQDVPDGNAEPAAEPQPPALPGHARNAPNNAAGENGAVPAQPRHNNNNNNHENWWNHYFVGGAIPARNPPPVPNGNENNNNNNNNQNIAPQQGAVGMELIHIAQDIGYLLGSFIFSIFPMWQPRARPQTEHDMAANDNATTEDDDVVPPIPTVAPPRNAMEPAEEDEEENDGHDNANHNNSGEQGDD